MPKIERWENLPERVRQHLIDRMRDRAMSVADLDQLRLWIETTPEVPEGDWYKDFGTFKICGGGSYPKTFLLRGKLRKVRLSDHRVPAGYSRLVGKDLGTHFRRSRPAVELNRYAVSRRFRNGGHFPAEHVEAQTQVGCASNPL